MAERDTRERVERVERAIEALEGLPADPRNTALDALTALVELYGEGWARALARVEDLAPGGAAFLAEDELVGHLLMVHDLHPEAMETRVRDALDGISEAVTAEGMEVELEALEGGAARVRFDRTPGSGFRDLVEETVLRAAPELDRVEIEGPAGVGGRKEPPLVQLRMGRPSDRGGDSQPDGSDGPETDGSDVSGTDASGAPEADGSHASEADGSRGRDGS